MRKRRRDLIPLTDIIFQVNGSVTANYYVEIWKCIKYIFILTQVTIYYL